MGDPRSFRKKYSGPVHPWNSSRIDEEFVLVREFGLKTKRELWKISSKLKNFANQAKRLISLRTDQSELETKQLLSRVSRLGLLSSGAELNDVLGLTVRDLLNRRLVIVVVKNGLANSPNQARQFIVHGHILVSGKKVTSPNFLVSVEDEANVCFVASSSLANPEHPERAVKRKVVVSSDESSDEKDGKSDSKSYRKSKDKSKVKSGDKSKSKFKDKKSGAQKGGKK